MIGGPLKHVARRLDILQQCNLCRPGRFLAGIFDEAVL